MHTFGGGDDAPRGRGKRALVSWQRKGKGGLLGEGGNVAVKRTNDRTADNGGKLSLGGHMSVVADI